MTQHDSRRMRAAAIQRFGGPETIAMQELPVPECGADEILIRVEYAGVGKWDPLEREGGFAQMFQMEARFPYVLGTEGAGTVEMVGERVRRFRPGDRVYAAMLVNPKGGFYAEYAAVSAEAAGPIPGSLSTQQAGVLASDALTGLRGLDEMLRVQPGESVMVFGASGGVGHLSVQLAKRMGARVLAVASGDDGVEMVRELGVDAVVDGRKEDAAEAARRFAAGGVGADDGRGSGGGPRVRGSAEGREGHLSERGGAGTERAGGSECEPV